MVYNTAGLCPTIFIIHRYLAVTSRPSEGEDTSEDQGWKEWTRSGSN